MSTSHTPPPIHDSEGRLTEDFIQNAFHSYLKSSLTQAKAERLLDVDMLSSAEGDLMITGPALCLYFAALRCTTNPPSVPLPRLSKTSPALDLSTDNCPSQFLPFLELWAQTVPDIQSLTPELQHDLARAICSLPPLAAAPSRNPIPRLAADLKAVAIEISQRRSFQDRYAFDLQAAIEAGGGSPRAKASFVPPPMYTPSPTSSTFPFPSSCSPPPPPPPSLTVETAHKDKIRPRTPTLLSPAAPAIELIRETLYAALADVLERTPSLRALLRRDPPRAYFAAVALAALGVATSAITPAGGVRGVLGQELTRAACPDALRPFMDELAALGRDVRAMEDADTDEAVRALQAGAEPPAPRMERVREMLEVGVGVAEAEARQSGAGRRSVEGRAVAFANRVNALALGLTKLRAFRERQDEVFKVLAGVGRS